MKYFVFRCIFKKQYNFEQILYILDNHLVWKSAYVM